MNNFPISFEDYLEPLSDSTGKSLKARLHRLSLAVDYIWPRPNERRAVKHFHQRTAKLLKGLNENGLLDWRFVLKAEYLDGFEDEPAEGDERETIVIDEQDLDRSLKHLLPIMTAELGQSGWGDVRRGIAVILMTYFVVHLLREADRVDHAAIDLDFPVNIYAQVDNALAIRSEVYEQTQIVNRFRALQVMMEVDGMNVDFPAQIKEVAKVVDHEDIRQFVLLDWLLRLRFYDLFADVAPYVVGNARLNDVLPEVRKDVLGRLEFLLREISTGKELEKLRPDRRQQIHEKVERRLAKCIGVNKNGLGWRIYRGLRGRNAVSRFRSEYLFEELLRSDVDRLATLNVIYTGKKRETKPNHPQYNRINEIFQKKYQPFFHTRIMPAKKGNEFEFAEKEIELDTGALG